MVFLEIHISPAISSIVTLLKPSFKNISVAFEIILSFIFLFHYFGANVNRKLVTPK
jgi:hypothetical protein